MNPAALFRSGIVGGAVCALLAGTSTVGVAGSVYVGIGGIGGGTPTMTVQSFQERKYQNTIAQEHDFSCGSAALATLLTYNYGIKTTETEVFTDMFEKGDKEVISKSGFSLLDMKNYLERRGLSSAGFRAPLDKLVEVKLPAIVLINVRGYRHFVVFEGVRGGWVLLSDPANGTRIEQVAEFERQWSGISFLLLSDIDQAQARFMTAQKWEAAPLPPMALSRFTLDLATLAQAGLIDLSRF